LLCMSSSLFILKKRPPPTSTLFPYTTLFRSLSRGGGGGGCARPQARPTHHPGAAGGGSRGEPRISARRSSGEGRPVPAAAVRVRSEEHTSELQSRGHLVCRLLLEKKKERQEG